MKSTGFVLLLLAVTGTILMSSCTKKYICRCEIEYSGTPGLPDSSVNEYDIYNTKAAAESICKEGSFQKEENGIKAVETCKLY